jgi:phosphoglycerol transferase MdoB-like AlkP superfamily enzyme
MQIELNRNDYLFLGTYKLVKVYFFIIGLLASFRFAFMLYFADKVIYEKNFIEILYAFYMGWRYDTIVAAYAIIVPFLLYWLSSLVLSKKIFNIVSFVSGLWFYLVIVLIIFISISDIGFYSFFQDHLNILFFGLFEDDTEAVLRSIWKNYPVEFALIGFLAFLVYLFFFLKKQFKFLAYKQPSLLNPGPIKFLILTFMLFVLLFGAARGGFGMMVLSPKYAEFSKNQFINHLAFNGVLSFEQAIKLRRSRTSDDFNMARAMGYGDDIHKAFSDFLEIDATPTKKEYLIQLLMRQTPSNPLLNEIRPHVIVLVMESFGSHWIQYNSGEFDFMGPLQNHFNEDIIFPNFVSGGNGTIGSLMVIGTNIPYRNGDHFISESRYMQLPLQSALHIPYKENGYETSFVYGGKLGWRDIGKYFSYQNYHHVEGESHIIEQLKLSGTQGTEWGLYDEHFFNFIQDKLVNTKRPQFILGLTTSNHPPFDVPTSFQAPKLSIPEALKGRITREQSLFLERFRAFQYANYKLAEFISAIKNSPLSNKTIIAVSGDHNFWGFMNYSNEENYSKYTVPFYLYLPPALRPTVVKTHQVGSHEDIGPTLYNLSLSEANYLAFGEDLLSSRQAVAINADIWASSEGVYIKDKSYAWQDHGPLVQIDPNPNHFDRLLKQVRATLSVADFYLRESLRQSHQNSKR